MGRTADLQDNIHYMREMMQRLGIDPGAGVDPHCSLSYMTALHRCQNCTQVEACCAWLESMPATTALPPRFCPNADIFFEMQVDQPGPHYGDKAARMAMGLGGI
jgi:hypothetical protein